MLFNGWKTGWTSVAQFGQWLHRERFQIDFLEVFFMIRISFAGIIMHELMHVVGFFHEQSRPDRDQYVDIIWNNIMDGMEGQFEKYEWKFVDSLNKMYDYGSVMHYAPTAFAR